jgi:hypothetical protein
MSTAIGLRGDFDATRLRAIAKQAKDGPQARRLLPLASIYEGATRTEAAKIGGVTLQIVRDWVLKFNCPWSRRVPQPQGAWPAVKAQGRTPDGAHADDREWANPGHPWRRALAARRSVPMGL